MMKGSCKDLILAEKSGKRRNAGNCKTGDKKGDMGYWKIFA